MVGPDLDVLQVIDDMLQRPGMFAQNAGSLEDQVFLLLSLDTRFQDTLHEEVGAFLKWRYDTRVLPISCHEGQDLDKVAEVLRVFVKRWL